MRDLNRGATDFLRVRWAAYVAKRIAIAELLGEIKPPQDSAVVPTSELPTSGRVSSLDLNSGRCGAAIRPAASALLSGEGE